MAHVFGHNCSLQFEERNYRVISVGTSRGVEPYRRVHTLDRFGRTAMSGKGASGAHLPLLFHWRYYSFTCRQFAFLFTIAHIFMIITHLVNHEGLERITITLTVFTVAAQRAAKPWVASIKLEPNLDKRGQRRRYNVTCH